MSNIWSTLYLHYHRVSNFTAAKRSLVIHGSNGASLRVACANIIPYGDSASVYDLTFVKTTYTT